MRSPTQPVSRTQALHIINEISRLDARNLEKRERKVDDEAEESIRLLRVENERLRAELQAAQTNKPQNLETETSVIEEAAARKKEGHLVVLTHGINTHALWMDNITPALTGAGFKVVKAGHGVMSAVKFLSPIRRFQKHAVKRVVEEIRSAIERHNPKYMSVIAHSFGTYVVAEIIRDYSEFKWKRVIFCGSVLRSDFHFNDLSERFDAPLLNEVGLSDWWPAFAEKAGWYYGSIGSNGLGGALVETRWHKQVTHSDFLTEKFCKRYWVPFLRYGRIIGANSAEPMPLLIRILTWPPYKYPLLLVYSFVFFVVPAALTYVAYRILYSLLVG
jgi:pimeloyl-ACP methyl ester carboxylesterase